MISEQGMEALLYSPGIAKGVMGGGPPKLDNVLSYKSDQMIWRI